MDSFHLNGRSGVLNSSRPELSETAIKKDDSIRVEDKIIITNCQQKIQEAKIQIMHLGRVPPLQAGIKSSKTYRYYCRGDCFSKKGTSVKTFGSFVICFFRQNSLF
ncbi:hypothetical protein A3A53_05895 [Candidatus Daviesbacteria bacterium RIFCSPLOWO2_01_FULL_39_23]|nr:MAG: hypothetical protein A3A53_05895 [Candidatus Daviesbacteria bacterium RIFCSPLOWO2_01_FULL_39_23]